MRPPLAKAACGSRPARSWSSSPSAITGALRRAMRGFLPSHRHGPHTEFLTVPTGQDHLLAVTLPTAAPPFLDATDIALVHLDGARQPVALGSHHRPPQFLQHRPGGLLAGEPE